MNSRDRVMAPGLSLIFFNTVIGIGLGNSSLGAPRAIARSEEQSEIIFARSFAVST
jgi:hypothetical protein